MIGKSSGNAYVFRGNQFAYRQTLTEPSQITFISLVGDFLAISENGCCVYIYKDDGSNFNLFQTINLSSTMARKATLARKKFKRGDIYLTISSPGDNSIKIYEYDDS